MLHYRIKPLRETKKSRLCLDTYVIRDKYCVGKCCSEPKNLSHKLAIASMSGYEMVELWHKDVHSYVSNFGVDRLTAELNERKLTVASYKVLENWMEGDDDLSVVRTAESIGAQSIVVKLIRDETNLPQKPISFYRERYKKLLDATQRSAIIPSLEFMSLAPYMNDLQSVCEVLREIDDPRCSLVLDCWHLWRNDSRNFNAFKKLAPQIKPEWINVVHFTDADARIPRENQRDGDRRLPGQGCLDLKAFCKLLPGHAILSLNTYDKSLWDGNPLQIAAEYRHVMKEYLEPSGDLSDAAEWSNNQVKRCGNLWSKQYYKNLDPRVTDSDRDAKLDDLLGKHLANKIVLDFKCGFSPLKKYVTFGFDACEECIDYLKKVSKRALWTVESDSEFASRFDEKIDVLMHLGLGDSNTEVESHLEIRRKCRPYLVIIECCANADGTVNESKPGNRARWEKLKEGLVDLESHLIITDMKERAARLVCVGRSAAMN